MKFPSLRGVTLGLVIGAVSVALVLAGNVGIADDASESRIDHEFNEKIRQYLLDNPDIVVEAFKIYQERERESQTQRKRQAVVAYRSELVDDPDSPVAGNPNSDLTVVEFFDYRCGYCKKILGTVMDYASADSNVRVIFKEFPILSPESEFAARAALAAVKQNKNVYVNYHNALMSSPGALTENRILSLGRGLGLDVARLRTDMNSPEITEMLRRNRELAERLGITGTPSMVVGDELVQGFVPRDAFERLLEQAQESG